MRIIAIQQYQCVLDASGGMCSLINYSIELFSFFFY